MLLIIQNGLIVDGSGKPGFYGDIVIDGDKIVDIIPAASRATRDTHQAPGTSGVAAQAPSIFANFRSAFLTGFAQG